MVTGNQWSYLSGTNTNDYRWFQIPFMALNYQFFRTISLLFSKKTTKLMNFVWTTMPDLFVKLSANVLTFGCAFAKLDIRK